MGIDCSGLVSMAFLLNGVMIYWDAAIKPGCALHEISFEAAKPGDLLFFPATWRCIWERDGLFTPPDIQVQKASSSAVLRKRRRITGRI
ncbi:MAG: NlpC/P60 family protein [Ruthenibacterium lactatiformans]